VHKWTTLLLAGAIATFLLALAVTEASANRLSVSNRNFRIVWLPADFGNTGVGNINIECDVTMEGSFHSATIAKTSGALVGFISRGTIANCINGRAEFIQTTLPWHVRYGGFEGTLPNISGVTLNIVGLGVTLEREGVTCTTHTTAAQPLVGIARTGAGGAVNSFRGDETRTFPLSREGLCLFAGEGKFSGSGSFKVLGTTQTVSIRLI
jgi:hypothetical protein